MTAFPLKFTGPDDAVSEVVVTSGEILFVLGANGTGKSTLMQVFAGQHRGHIRRLTAHRQVWFNSDTIDITPLGRQQTEKQISSADTQAQSRWRDDQAAQRGQATIFDLVDAENVEARQIANAARSGDMDRVAQLVTSPAPIARMNDILRVSNLHFRVEVKESKLIAVREGYEPFSIAELSDGERNALLTAANVLTAPHDTLFLIDEPERHLHRGIVSPLITTLLAHRPDCAFVVSTHDVALPLDQPQCSALLVRMFSHTPQQWTIDLVENVEELDEGTAEAVLGSRRLLLFIEGVASSLDLQLYQILFPLLSIRTMGSCTEVERAVRGLQAADSCHWLTPIGLVDRDNRDDEECRDMLAHGIVALDQYSVESLYYHPHTIEQLSSRVSNVFGSDTNKTLPTAEGQFIEAVSQHADRLAARLVERRIRMELLIRIPDWRAIESGDLDVQFDGGELYREEQATIQRLIAERNVEKLVCRYPIRETPAPTMVAKTLGFQSRHAYEQAVRKMLADSQEARASMLTLVQPLADLVVNSGIPT
ncbi:MAG: ABC-type Mn2+/Zn2+ transport system ATPase subunit [Pirellulaceae bacterium]|jgi:ABC-type Mn2+/Zn2+ transport system ATPase subunit